jgi:hypothetical protein
MKLTRDFETGFGTHEDPAEHPERLDLRQERVLSAAAGLWTVRGKMNCLKIYFITFASAHTLS